MTSEPTSLTVLVNYINVRCDQGLRSYVPETVRFTTSHTVKATMTMCLQLMAIRRGCNNCTEDAIVNPDTFAAAAM